jgi:hypothetical protein
MNIKSLPNEILWRISTYLGREHDIRRDIRNRMAYDIRNKPGATYPTDYEEKMYQQTLVMIKNGMTGYPTMKYEDLFHAIHGRPP